MRKKLPGRIPKISMNIPKINLNMEINLNKTETGHTNGFYNSGIKSVQV